MTRKNKTGQGAKPAPTPPPVSHHKSKRLDPQTFLDASQLHARQQDGGAGESPIRFDRSRGVQSEMDMTPMVDVTFLLLIFFMVTAAFSLQKSLQVPTPQDDQASENVQQLDPQDDPDTVTVHVDEFSTFHVTTTDWDAEAPGEHELLRQLRRAREGNSQNRIPTRLLVMANREALHEKVVTALDAGTEVGMDEVQLMMVDDDQR
jgi:biopolymer transport protein ExbD